MTLYLLNIHQPDGDPPPPEHLGEIMKRVDALGEEMREAGALVFTGGLHRPSRSTVVRLSSDQVVVTDGPYTESKEHIGGFWILEAEDLDAALGWARKATRATTLPIEVRPFQHGGASLP